MSLVHLILSLKLGVTLILSICKRSRETWRFEGDGRAGKITTTSYLGQDSATAAGSEVARCSSRPPAFIPFSVQGSWTGERTGSRVGLREKLCSIFGGEIEEGRGEGSMRELEISLSTSCFGRRRTLNKERRREREACVSCERGRRRAQGSSPITLSDRTPEGTV